MSAWFCRSTDGKVAQKIVPPRLRIPYWKGLSADSEEKHEPVRDIDTVVVDSLKALDPKWPPQTGIPSLNPRIAPEQRSGASMPYRMLLNPALSWR